MRKGYIQLYTGNGKGKTTAAFGVALRILGAGGRVYIGQFLKKGNFSEIRAFAVWGEKITIEQFGSGQFIVEGFSENDKLLAENGFAKCVKAIDSCDFDLVVMDEITLAVYLGLIDEENILRVLRKKPDCVELILTGRNATDDIIEASDLVTEMREIKHYYKQGVAARVGIEE